MSKYPVEVVRSARRQRTVSASLTGGRIRVLVPADLDPSEEARLVNELADKVRAKVESSTIDLEERSRALAGKYRLPLPRTIEWSHRQQKRWGSCTPSRGHVRISSRLTSLPGWVLDSVIVHELAHLEVPTHGRQFEELVSRYPLTERARGYLIAMDHQNHSPPASET